MVWILHLVSSYCGAKPVCSYCSCGELNGVWCFAWHGSDHSPNHQPKGALMSAHINKYIFSIYYLFLLSDYIHIYTHTHTHKSPPVTWTVFILSPTWAIMVTSTDSQVIYFLCILSMYFVCFIIRRDASTNFKCIVINNQIICEASSTKVIFSILNVYVCTSV